MAALLEAREESGWSKSHWMARAAAPEEGGAPLLLLRGVLVDGRMHPHMQQIIRWAGGIFRECHCLAIVTAVPTVDMLIN